ncbi:recombinase family protein [Streptomyces sp. NPDC056831]|uniref:recombinase family protein n=1 Tax=Streptomyces sp. NPDC056831 TaxID=3345954 RepID=UPI00369757CF
MADAIPCAAIRLGYARCSTVGQELQSQLDMLARADCTRVFSEKISTRVKERPELEKALTLAREIKAAAPNQAVILTVVEMKRLARSAAELMTLSSTLQADGIQLELLSGPLQGVYDPNGAGAIVFAVLAVSAEVEREGIREKTLEGLDAAARKGNIGGRPSVVDDDKLAVARARHAKWSAPEVPRGLTAEPTMRLSAGQRSGPAPTGRGRTGRDGVAPRRSRQAGTAAEPHKPTVRTHEGGQPPPDAVATKAARATDHSTATVDDGLSPGTLGALRPRC